MFVGNWLALGVDPLRPVQRNEWLGEHAFSVGPIEHKEVAIARGLRQQFARLAIDLRVKEDWSLGVVPIVGIVGRSLKIPDELAGIGIQRND